jgi:ADP-heptose:LPS heptosyltransferase
MRNKYILIFRLGSLGDTLMALPAFNRIKELYPEHKILLLSNIPINQKAASIASILRKGHFYDQIINYPIATRNPFLLIKLALKLRQYKIDSLFYLTQGRSKNHLKRDLAFFKVSGISNFRAIPTHSNDFELEIDPNTGLYEWEAKRLARRLWDYGQFELSANKYWDLHLTDSEIEKASQLLNDFPKNVFNICISPGTKMQSKDWGKENWHALVEALDKEFEDFNLIILGSNDEKGLGDYLTEARKKNSINLSGITSPRESAAVMKYAHIFIGHDSGPMHMAGTVGVPCVAIFSARNLLAQWLPRGNNNVILYKQVHCAGCDLEICIDEKKHCILSITVNEVFENAKKILNGK